jgi:hypothetical protein
MVDGGGRVLTFKLCCGVIDDRGWVTATSIFGTRYQTEIFWSKKLLEIDILYVD